MSIHLHDVAEGFIGGNPVLAGVGPVHIVSTYPSLNRLFILIGESYVQITFSTRATECRHYFVDR